MCVMVTPLDLIFAKRMNSYWPLSHKSSLNFMLWVGPEEQSPFSNPANSQISGLYMGFHFGWNI